MKGTLRRVLSLVLCAMIAIGGMTLPVDAAEISESIPVYTEAVAHRAEAREVLKLVNQERAKVGAKPLTMTAELEEIAIVRATELTAYFSHTRPDGRYCDSALEDFEIDVSGMGENIAFNQVDADDVMDSWMHSDGHRGNILDPSYVYIGIACVEYGGAKHWVQYFTGESDPATSADASAKDNEQFSTVYLLDPEYVEDCSISFLEGSASLKFGEETALDLLVAGNYWNFLGVVYPLPELVTFGNLVIPENAPLTLTDEGMLKAEGPGETGTYTVTFKVGNLSASKKITISCSHPASAQSTERVDPTCGKEGYEKVECTLCGKVLSEKKLPMTQDHSMSEWETVTDPDCTHEGERERVCENCGHKETETIPELGHKEKVETVKEATCLTPGETVTNCERCGKELSRDTVQPLGHDWSEWTITQEATWDTSGERVRTCARCGLEDKETIPAESVGHEHDFTGAETILKEATCTEPGLKEIACSNPKCDAVKQEDIPATGHDWSEWETVVEPTWDTRGSETRVCAACGESQDREIPSLQESHVHDFSVEGEVIEEATCTEAGSKIMICSEPLCREERTFVIPATGHTAGEWENTKEATCTEKGEQIQKCTVCGDVVATKEIPMTEHAYGEWAVVKEATVSEAGERQRVCADCGYVDKMMIDKLPAQQSSGNQDSSIGEAASSETGNGGAGKDSAVKTGDDSFAMVWVLAILISSGVGVGAYTIRRKRAGK